MPLFFQSVLWFLVFVHYHTAQGFSSPQPRKIEQDMPPPFIDKLALILVQGRKHLVARSKGKTVYFTPGGKRESGEDDNMALCRECKEELTVDLVPSSIRPYGVFEAEAFGKAPGTIVRMTCYTADYTGTLQANEEVEELTWIDSSFPQEKLTLAGKQILADLKQKDLID